ncbi:MAG TPA: multiheme c-type cytochrome [Prolixibacteraceae bacterium]|nr:multiheme c-type cytochrome [Prolixibacteraceae bacterium]
MKKIHIYFFVVPTLILLATVGFKLSSEEDGDKKGAFKYKDFQSPTYCKQCHNQFYQQWSQSMMSQAYTHEWDEIEYFKLAVAHAEAKPELKDVVDGCNGCHTPMAYLAGDVTPPKPSENSRANESVSCEVCHLIKGIEGDTAYNFNWVIEPGKTKYSSRKGDKESPNHKIVATDLHSDTRICGSCHNEKSPFGVWVKSTQLEWMAGPYAEDGVMCQECHMPSTEMQTAKMGTTYPDTRTHLFNGAHDPGKVRGTIEVRIQPDIRETVPGETVVLTTTLFNQKTGHKFPTGSVEDRIVWLHVEAEDEDGNIFHLPVDKKGFEGEEYTIASDVLAYQDMGVPLGIENFEGVRREDVPIGDRIFRMPYFDPEGRMTIMQWNTASLGVDYRIGPRETKTETYTFDVPFDIKPGKVKVNAKLYYRLLVKPVGEYLDVPEEEYTALEVNNHSTEITVFP